ncbi:MAG: hypothetical protein V3V96_14335 [Acidiferrobacterales bacterium]
MVDIFVTNVALHGGGIRRGKISDEMAAYLRSGERDTVLVTIGNQHQFIEKPHWHFDRREAVGRAEQLRNSRIAWHLKQVRRLEALTFEQKEGAE